MKNKFFTHKFVPVAQICRLQKGMVIKMDHKKKAPEVRFAGFADDWEQRKLGEVLKYEQPQAYIVESTVYNDSYSIPVLTAGQSFILGYTEEDFGVKNANEMEPVIIFDDFTTSSHYVDFPFKVKSSAMKLLTLNEKGKDNIHFAFNVLKNIKYIPFSHERHWISTFANFDILIPSSEEQQCIGAFFHHLDHLITLHQRKYDKLVVWKKSMLEKMFPKNDSKVPEIRFAGFTGDWEQCKFEDIFKLSQGLQIPISNRFLEPGKDRYFYITNEFLKDNCQEAYYILNPPTSVICNEDDVLMTRTGNTGIVVTDVKGCFHNNFFKIAYDKCNFDKRYICYYLSSNEMQKTILKNAGSSTIPDLSHKSFYEISGLFPKKEEQIQIGEYFCNLDLLITLHQRKLERLKTMKKSLLEKMFV